MTGLPWTSGATSMMGSPVMRPSYGAGPGAVSIW
jgi:hypothetical protein